MTSIIGAASIAGKQGTHLPSILPLAIEAHWHVGFAENSAYCASKFAIRGLGQAVGERSASPLPDDVVRTLMTQRSRGAAAIQHYGQHVCAWHYQYCHE